MPTVTVRQSNIPPETVINGLRKQLGERYTVEGDAGQVYKVSTSPMVGARVHQREAAGATEFHVHGTGIIIGRIVNELVIARKVAAAIGAAPELGGAPTA